MGLIKAVMFDLDGVIVDTSNYHYLSWKKLCLELDYNLNESGNDFLKGLSREDSLLKIIDLANISLPKEKFKEYLIKKNSYYLDFINIFWRNIIYKIKIIRIFFYKVFFKFFFG